MEEFTCCLADVRVGIHANFPETRIFCRDYLTEEPADFSVSISAEDILYEQELSRKTSLKEYGKIIHYPDPYLETLAVYRKIADGMLDYDTVLFHGSAIAVDKDAYLFTAKSGTGKSTHTRLWREMLGDRAYMVNDDKPLLKVTDDGVFVYGTPWDGKHHLSRNVSVALKAICLLQRDAANHIVPISPKEMVPTAMQQIYLPSQPEAMLKMLSLIEKMLHHTALYCLGCNMEPDAARVSYEGMR